MRLCPECGVVVLENIRFCLQCGTSLPTPGSVMPSAVEDAPESQAESPTVTAPPVPAPEAPPARGELDSPPQPPPDLPPAEATLPPPAPTSPEPIEVVSANDAPLDEDFVIPRPVYTPNSTLIMRSSPSPMIAPREGVPLERPRGKPGRDMVEIDEEVLNKPAQKSAVEGSSVLCRFCRGPLDMDGDFCEQCGAPVIDAAPPGTIKPKNLSVSPAVRPLSVADPPTANPTAPEPGKEQVARETPAGPAFPDPASRAPESPPGLVGRLRNVFKRD